MSAIRKGDVVRYRLKFSRARTVFRVVEVHEKWLLVREMQPVRSVTLPWLDEKTVMRESVEAVR